jgi:peptidoglycan/LPS O-acetylase OafA/YrhL
LNRRLQNLDALRGLAALTVLIPHLLGHVWRAMPAETIWLKTVGLDYFDWGRFGVVLFFLISGHVIPLSFSGPTPLRKFIISRAFRLYPAFWLAVLAMSGVIVIATRDLDVRQVLANLTMDYPVFKEQALSGVYWTLVVEILFYITATALFIAGALERPIIVAAVALLAIASAVVPMSANMQGMHVPVTLLGYHLSFLLLGALIRQALTDVPYGRPMAWLVGIAIGVTLPLVSGLLTGQFTNFTISQPTGVIYAIAAALALYLLFWLPRFQSQPWFALSLGAWSYSIYLFHEPIADAVTWVIAPTNGLQAVAFVVAVTAITIVVAYFIYRFIEAPAIALGKTLVRGSPPRASIEVAP